MAELGGDLLEGDGTRRAGPGPAAARRAARRPRGRPWGRSGCSRPGSWSRAASRARRAATRGREQRRAGPRRGNAGRPRRGSAGCRRSPRSPLSQRGVRPRSSPHRSRTVQHEPRRSERRRSPSRSPPTCPRTAPFVSDEVCGWARLTRSRNTSDEHARVGHVREREVVRSLAQQRGGQAQAHPVGRLARELRLAHGRAVHRHAHVVVDRLAGLRRPLQEDVELGRAGAGDPREQEGLHARRPRGERPPRATDPARRAAPAGRSGSSRRSARRRTRVAMTFEPGAAGLNRHHAPRRSERTSS